ncbi:hypothetical protein HYH03_002185 [Edaphochlamys debaryana]|uniref:Bulb-type lectin domain-containing protein n=1 Tax=Edaphochlamys debaryana TaxID=47281 RepID=A0A835YE13_9CHLO|nr:hypothetical protein HYH03_002185 [Edaphochlamys debaryana]|eukprot:KAG2499897.1 hypothetical protein HYH03_002185 [Edaphochlamys debaryana]
MSLSLEAKRELNDTIQALSLAADDSKSFVVSVVEAAARGLPTSNILCNDRALARRRALYNDSPGNGSVFQGRAFHVSAFEYGHFEAADESLATWACHGDSMRCGPFVTFPRCRRGDTLWTSAERGDELRAYDVLTSGNGRYTAIMQFDGNFVVYEDCQPNPWGQGAIWNTFTCGHGSYPHTLTLQADGNLVLTDRFRSALWRSRSGGSARGPFRLCMQDDGALVLYDSWGGAVWSSR